MKIHEDRILPIQSEDFVEVKGLSSGWKLCFPDPQVEPQYLSLCFYYSCYTFPMFSNISADPCFRCCCFDFFVCFLRFAVYEESSSF